MAQYHYRAVDPSGRRVEGAIEATSLHDATETLRSREVEVLGIELAGATPADVSPRRFEPIEPRPGPAPRDIDIKLSSQPGGIVLVLVGGIFTAIASVFVVIGLSLLATGNSEGLLFALIPSIHLIVGSALLFFGLRGWLRRRRIYRQGEVAMATIEGVGFNRSVRINGRNPYEVIWWFEVDGHRHHDKQSTFDERVHDFVPGDRIWVLYDPLDPEQSAEWPPLGRKS